MLVIELRHSMLQSGCSSWADILPDPACSGDNQDSSHFVGASSLVKDRGGTGFPGRGILVGIFQWVFLENVNP